MKISLFLSFALLIANTAAAREWCEVQHSGETLRNSTNHTYVSNMGLVDDHFRTGCTGVQSAKTQAAAPAKVMAEDTDGDGVTDLADRCANTPKGTTVNLFGCEKKANTADELVVNVKFSSGSAQINQNEVADLEALTQALLSDSDLKIKVTGHTDATGSPAANVKLSQARAEAVKAYLLNKGISSERVKALGIGSEKPVATNETATGRAQNRRITVDKQ